MKITRSEYEKALAKHYGVVGVTRYADLPGDTSASGIPAPLVGQKPHSPAVEGVLRELGIEIVPDPEPELPERPWSFGHKKGHGFWIDPGHYVYRDGKQLIHRVCLQPMMQEDHEAIAAILEALVSAYNAAGERKRITLKKDRYDHWYVETVGDDYTYARPDYAIGAYVRTHASDLGLEIVES